MTTINPELIEGAKRIDALKISPQDSLTLMMLLNSLIYLKETMPEEKIKDITLERILMAYNDGKYYYE